MIGSPLALVFAFSGLHLEERRTRLGRYLLGHAPAARDGSESRAQRGLQRAEKFGIHLFAGEVHWLLAFLRAVINLGQINSP